MTELFANKYRIPSARFQSWNYGTEAMYFITICTKYKECYFGEIVCRDAMPGVSETMTTDNNTLPVLPNQSDIIHNRGEKVYELKPTVIGKIAYNEWYKTIEL